MCALVSGVHLYVRNHAYILGWVAYIQLTVGLKDIVCCLLRPWSSMEAVNFNLGIRPSLCTDFWNYRLGKISSNWARRLINRLNYCWIRVYILLSPAKLWRVSVPELAHQANLISSSNAVTNKWYAYGYVYLYVRLQLAKCLQLSLRTTGEEVSKRCNDASINDSNEMRCCIPSCVINSKISEEGHLFKLNAVWYTMTSKKFILLTTMICI